MKPTSNFLWIFTLLVEMLIFKPSAAQISGEVDTTFRITRNGTLEGSIYKVVVQPDEKVVAFGNFAGMGNYSSPYLLRFHSNGLLDTSFHSPFWAGQVKFNTYEPLYEGNGPQLLPDGGFLVSGLFDSVGADSIRGIALLHPNGKIDTSFRPYKTDFSGSLAYKEQMSAFRTDSGKVYTLYLNKENPPFGKSCLGRFLANGEWDTSFHFSLPDGFYEAYAFKISPLRNGNWFINWFFPCNVCPPDGGPWYIGSILTDSGSNVSLPQYGWRWVQEDSLGNLFGSWCMLGWTGVSPPFLKYKPSDQFLVSYPLDGSFIDNGILMENNELIISRNFDLAYVGKILQVDTLPVLVPFGSADNDILSMARTPSNQIYIAGKFNQYNAQPYAKLVRVHNSQTILNTKPLQKSSFSIYPNPSSDNRCMIKGASNFEIISVTDALGKSIPFSISSLSEKLVTLQLDNRLSNRILFLRIKGTESISILKWAIGD